MRVIEPHQLKRATRRRFPVGLFVSVLFGVVVISGAGWWLFMGRSQGSGSPQTNGGLQSPSEVAGAQTATAKEKTTPKIFTGNEFKDLYLSVLATYPNTEAFPSQPSITGDDEADAHIRSLAEARGFQLTRIPVTALVKLNEPLVSGEKDDLLQPAAHKAWEDIKAAAKKDNIPLGLLSAYRSPDFQRTLFMSRLADAGASNYQIAHNQADAAIATTLGVTALPGYSRHHTGYAVDFWCEDGSGAFKDSSCFDWLEADNYLHAKEFGWIPSYPEGADVQGPEPEPWEYVWVGRNLLFE